MSNESLRIILRIENMSVCVSHGCVASPWAQSVGDMETVVQMQRSDIQIDKVPFYPPSIKWTLCFYRKQPNPDSLYQGCCCFQQLVGSYRFHQVKIWNRWAFSREISGGFGSGGGCAGTSGVQEGLAGMNGGCGCIQRDAKIDVEVYWEPVKLLQDWMDALA